MIIKIAGVPVDYQSGSIDIDNAINVRSTASFSILDRPGEFSFLKGQPVKIYEDDETTLIFDGYIDKPVSEYLSLASNSKIHKIDCVDNLYISDKKIIAKVYRGMYAGDIVRDIITNYLQVDGVTAGTIQDGPIVTEAVFNYSTATKALERLAELAAFEFNIDKNKQVQFFHRATNYNNTIITETSDIKNVKVSPEAEEYRNKQYIRAGMDTTDEQTESKKGDGTAKTFTVGYPVAQVPTITVNGAAQTVGIRGVDEGKQWYWNKGEKEITQDDSGTPLTTAQTLVIKYRGLFNIVVISYDNTEIQRLKDIDGTSGIVESVIDDPYITDRQTAFDDAAAKLARYAKEGRRITFETKITGLDPGQLIQVVLPSYGIDDYFLIESSRATELGTADGRLTYDISIVDGSATGGWANFFKQLANKGEAYVVRENIQENEVISTIEYFTKTWNQNELPNIYKKIYPGSATYPGANTIASFEDNQRVRFLTFYSNNIELFRKAVTKTTTTDTQIITTTYISPADANTAITHVGWIGGDSANSNAGTGVLIDKQAYAKIKTNLETIQIDKTDKKGW